MNRTIANIVIWKKMFERHRRVVMESRLLCAEGIVQKEEPRPDDENRVPVIHLVARELRDFSHYLRRLYDDQSMGARLGTAAAAMPEGRNFH